MEFGQGRVGQAGRWLDRRDEDLQAGDDIHAVVDETARPILFDQQSEPIDPLGLPIEAIAALDFDLGGDAVDGPFHRAGDLACATASPVTSFSVLWTVDLGHFVQAEQGRHQLRRVRPVVADGHGLFRQQPVEQQAVGLHVDGVQLIAAETSDGREEQGRLLACFDGDQVMSRLERRLKSAVADA